MILVFEFTLPSSFSSYVSTIESGAFLLLRAPLEALGGGWRFVSHLLGADETTKDRPSHTQMRVLLG